MGTAIACEVDLKGTATVFEVDVKGNCYSL